MDSVRRRPAAAAVLLAVLMGLLCGCKYLVRDASFLYLKVNAALSDRDIEVEIQRSFAEKYKDRVSINTVSTVDKTLAKPRPGLLDGDLHFAGRATEIGLPVVAEIANAETVMPAVDLVNRFEGTGQPLGISGVWRICSPRRRTTRGTSSRSTRSRGSTISSCARLSGPSRGSSRATPARPSRS